MRLETVSNLQGSNEGLISLDRTKFGSQSGNFSLYWGLSAQKLLIRFEITGLLPTEKPSNSPRADDKA